MIANESIEIGGFDATLRHVSLPMGLVVDTVHISGADLSLRSSPFSASLAAPGDLEITVLEDAVAAFLEAQNPAGMRDFQVKLEENKLKIEALKKVVVDLKVKAVCSLRLDDGERVFVMLDSVDVMGAGIKQLVQTQLDKINPVIDVSFLPFPAKLRELTCADGKILIRGEASPPKTATK